MFEIGGDFHWQEVPQGTMLSWPQPHRWYASGRGALLALWHTLTTTQIGRTVHLPVYFCPHTVAYWRARGVPIRTYLDDPSRTEPDWTTLHPNPGDVVIAVNYFGIRDSAVWHTWLAAHTNIISVGDHSHDPLSNWAFSDTFTYGFASIRKTSPIPDGALLWASGGATLPLDPPPSSVGWTGSALKLAAMVLKANYLRDQPRQALKERFRELQIAGEEHLANEPVQGLSPWSRVLIDAGFPQAWREQRANNVRSLLGMLPETDRFVPLFRTWSPRQCPFNVVLMFRDATGRAEAREGLIDAQIYCSVHWPLSETSNSLAYDVSQRILTIPVDQRYGQPAIERIAKVLTLCA